MTPSPRTAPIPLIAYGSLMSGMGLAPLGALRPARVGRVAFPAARRGFAKHSQRGNRFAMVLEPIQDGAPLEARRVAADATAGALPEGLLLEISPAVLQQIALREGYSPVAMAALLDAAAAHGLPLADYLWEELSAAEFDVARYRERLWARIGYTSPHYIPHPVTVDGSGRGLTFLAPGVEGTGSTRVVAVRSRTGNPPLMTAARAWRNKPNATQLTYFATCFLGALHGICLQDLIDDDERDSELETRLRPLLVAEGAAEAERFRAATGLVDDAYQRWLGNPALLPARSGVMHLFDQRQTGA